MPIPKVSIKQIKAARELLGWSQEAIAEASGSSIPTIKRLEATGGELGGRPETGEKIIAALEKAGVEFIAENGGGPGVRIRKSAKGAEEISRSAMSGTVPRPKSLAWNSQRLGLATDTFLLVT